jgi:hypothetical protein
MKRRDDGIDVQGKAPAFQFYPADYERDMQTLGLSEQGLWMRMLCKMHWAKRRGYLEHPSGVPISAEELARMVGQSVEKVQQILTSMERVGIFSKEKSGVIFSRRMAHDTEISNKRKQAGKLGGNPDLVKQMDLVNQNEATPFLVNQTVLDKQNDLVNQNALDKQNVNLDKQNENLDNQTNSNDRLLKPLSEICLPACIEQNDPPSYSYSSSSSPSGTPSSHEPTFINSEKSKLPPPVTQDEKLGWAQTALHGYTESCAGYACSTWAPPDPDLCRQFLEATNGANLGLVGQFLKELRKSDQRPEKNYAWFVTMARKTFQAHKLEKAGHSLPAIP